jgi:NAD(P)-dependent dehydrogenase (short-subunit alcohol dehydrogenase family)
VTTAKTFLVTGATQGLGRAIAAALAANPAHHVVLAVRDEARTLPVARAIGPRAEVRRLDVGSRADVARFVAEWRASGRPLAGLCNNAGLQQTAGARFSLDDWYAPEAGAAALVLHRRWRFSAARKSSSPIVSTVNLSCFIWKTSKNLRSECTRSLSRRKNCVLWSRKKST